MFDTMTVTKVAGSFFGALLVFLLGNWVAESMYHTGGGHGHGDEEHLAGYVIEVEGADEGGEEEAGVDFAALWAEADEGKGAKVFGKCKACHKLEDGANSTGPHLYGVVGRDVGSEDFGYSGALVAVAQTWGIDELNAFLESPKGYAPGTKMAFSGLSKPEDRADLILYLDMTDGDRTDYAAPAAAEDEAAMEEDAAEETTEAAEATEEATEEMTETAEAAEEAASEEAAEATDEAMEESTEAAEATEEAAEETTEATEATEEAEMETAAADEATEDTAETAEATEAAAEGDAADGFAAMVAAADADAGKKAFRKCAACHKVEDGKNGVGPHLYGVVDRAVGSVDGFKYSGNLVKVADVWDVDNLNAFLTKPKDFAPGTKMVFAGLHKEEDRANVIKYLDSLDD